MTPELMLGWNFIVAVILVLVSWNWKTVSSEVTRLNILLNRAREEMTKEYATKAEVHADINRVIQRLEACLNIIYIGGIEMFLDVRRLDGGATQDLFYHLTMGIV